MLLTRATAPVDREALLSQPLADRGDVRHFAAFEHRLDLRVLRLRSATCCSTHSAASWGTATTPFASATTISPGRTTTPPQATGTFTSRGAVDDDAGDPPPLHALADVAAPHREGGQPPRVHHEHVSRPRLLHREFDYIERAARHRHRHRGSGDSAGEWMQRSDRGIQRTLSPGSRRPRSPPWSGAVTRPSAHRTWDATRRSRCRAGGSPEAATLAAASASPTLLEASGIG